MSVLEANDRASYREKLVHWKGPPTSALGHKRTFAPQNVTSAFPDSDHESDFSQKPMSALTPKRDMCGAVADVC
jgi:hypothetical protein